MAARPSTFTNGLVCRPYTVTAANTVRRGYPVVFSAGVTTIVEASAIADNVIGIAYEAESGTWPAAAGTVVSVALLGQPCAVPALVGTTTVAAAGDPICVDNAAGNGTRTAVVGGGANKLRVLGTAMELGAAGDLIGCYLGTASWSVGS